MGSSSKLRVQTFSLTISLVVFAFLFGQSYHVTEGFKQSLKLYFENTTQSDFLDFQTNHPNLDEYSGLLPKVKQACSLGLWISFSAANYLGTYYVLGSFGSNQTECVQFNGTNTKSFRHIGMNETLSDGLSLYEGDIFRGAEILVEGSAYAGITRPIKSIAGTGKSQWKIFEGQHLEGKSVCITVPTPGFNFYAVDQLQLYINLTTIGSVFKGCNILDMEEYKRQNNI